jgi:hypothetical protein
MAPKGSQGYSCVVIPHKSDLLGLTTKGLLARRSDLAAGIGELDRLLLGSLVEQTRRCGREKCRCATATPHGPYAYLSIRRFRYALCAEGHGRLRAHVPAARRTHRGRARGDLSAQHGTAGQTRSPLTHPPGSSEPAHSSRGVPGYIFCSCSYGG